jgi:hypothetical protein
MTELLALLTDIFGTDTLTSPTSTAPYAVDELQKMLSLTNSLKSEILAHFHVDLSPMFYAYFRKCRKSIQWFSMYSEWVRIFPMVRIFADELTGACRQIYVHLWYVRLLRRRGYVVR